MGGDPDGRGLVAGRALDHVLFPFARDVDAVLADAANDHGSAAVDAVVRRRSKVVDRRHDHGVHPPAAAADTPIVAWTENENENKQF